MIDKEKLKEINHALIARYEDRTSIDKGPRGTGLYGDFIAYGPDDTPLVHITYNCALYNECLKLGDGFVSGYVSDGARDHTNEQGSIEIHIDDSIPHAASFEELISATDLPFLPAFLVAKALNMHKFTLYKMSRMYDVMKEIDGE